MGIAIEGFSTNVSEDLVLKGIKEEMKKEHPNAKLNKLDNVNFESLMQRKREDTLLDIYTDGNGTIVTASHKFLFNFLHFKLSEHFPMNRFVLDETSMRFQFSKYRDGKIIEDIIIQDHNKRDIFYRTESQDKFAIEDSEDIFFYAFPRFIKEFYHADFHNIPLESNVSRYELVNFNREEYYFV